LTRSPRARRSAPLRGARRRDPGGHRGGAVARGGQVEIGEGHRRHLDPQIEAVHQRARDPAEIVLAAGRHPGAGARRIGEVAAFAGVGGGHQQEAAGIAHMGVGAGDHTSPVSIGWRRVSSTVRGNSGNSSMNSTPLCARLISPGLAPRPPPTMAAIEAV
jgi:hypothetical protein